MTPEIIKGIENKLKTSEERYRRLFETARDGILILNSKNGEIEDVNPFLEQLLGYSKKEFLGKKLWEVGVFKNTKASKETFKELQEKGYIRYENLPLETKDGRLIEVEFVSNAYMAGEERVMQCNIRDISERKKLEAADKLTLFLDQEKLKTSFVADVTHELRTPLAIIKGNVDLALRDKKTIQIETFRAINLEVDHLAEMLSNLTILTSENKNFHAKINTHEIDLAKVISNVISRLETISVLKKVKIVTKELPKTIVLGDVMYLEKLFSNLIKNGIYYGKKNGSITISMKKHNKSIIISFADNGIGIAKKDLPSVFNRFYRASKAKAINHEGTGLGLAISKWVVESHGGEISLTSVFGKGSTFTVTLPAIK